MKISTVAVALLGISNQANAFMINPGIRHHQSAATLFMAAEEAEGSTEVTDPLESSSEEPANELEFFDDEDEEDFDFGFDDDDDILPGSEAEARRCSSREIAHLQKKLKYWKKEQAAKEAAYKQYLTQYAIEHKTNPICVREGTVDHYRARPIYNEETERIQTEVWSLKEQIKLANAKLHEERRIIEVRKETAEKLEQHDAEVLKLKTEANAKMKEIQEEAKKEQQAIRQATEEQAKKEQEDIRHQLEDQAQAEQEKLRKEAAERMQTVQDKAKAQQEQIRKALKEEQKQIRKDANARMQAMKQKAEEERHQIRQQAKAKVEALETKSTERLTQKEEEIDTLATEIQNLIDTLNEKRSELEVKEGDLHHLEEELQEKGAVLNSLEEERASIRAMARQSWRVFKARFKRKVLRKKEKTEEEDDDEETPPEPEMAEVTIGETDTTIKTEVPVAKGEQKNGAKKANGEKQPEAVEVEG